MSSIKTNFGEEGIIIFTTDYGQYAIFSDHIRPEDGVNGERYYSLEEAKAEAGAEGAVRPASAQAARLRREE
mgnify:CR=1 FL=1